MTAAYGCCGQALTRFTGHPCTGPGRRRGRVEGDGSGPVTGFRVARRGPSGRPPPRSGAFHRVRGSAYRPVPYHLFVGTHEPSSGTIPRVSSHEAEARQRTILLRVVRGSFLILFFTVTLLFLLSAESGSSSSVVAAAINWSVWVSIAVAIALLVVVIDVFIPRKKISTLSAMFLGLLASMAATWAIGAVIELVARSWLNSPQAIDEFRPFIGLIKVLVGIALAYLCISTILQTQDDFRLVIPYVEFAKQLRGSRPLILDTSAIIDARIVDVSATGVLQAPIVVPAFVVNELQSLADSSDRTKRAARVARPRFCQGTPTHQASSPFQCREITPTSAAPCSSGKVMAQLQPSPSAALRQLSASQSRAPSGG